MKLHAITIDTIDPQKLAAWWSEALNLEIAADFGVIVQLVHSSDLPPFQFQKVVDTSTHRNRVHVDLKTPDLDGEVARLVAIGARVEEIFELPQIRYASLLDPDGNKFDLVAE